MLNACLGWSLDCVSLLHIVFHSIISSGSHTGKLATRLSKVCMYSTVAKKLSTSSDCKRLRAHALGFTCQKKLLAQAMIFKKKGDYKEP
jgi:hypothetical protein